MFITSLVSWWYGQGWLDQYERCWMQLVRIGNFFSISLLVKTLFSPFRQISAERVTATAPLEYHLRAFFDKLISRTIGASVRLITILIGISGLLIVACICLCWLVIWALLPIMPFIGLIMTLKGVMPW